MRAAVIVGVGKYPVIQDVETPVPHSDEALIQVNYAALNHRDIWIQKGQYASIQFPVIPGSDLCGKVISVGKAVPKFLIGKEVIVNPGFNWGDNQRSQSRNFHILGMPTQGTLAEYVCIDQKYIYEKPSHLSSIEAAALPLAGITAYRAVFSQGKLQPGQKILITGAGGGVAHWAIKFSKAVNAEIWVTSSSNHKISSMVKWGIKGGQNYKEENWTKKLIQQSGDFDLIIDSTGGEFFSKYLEMSKPGGTIVVYGATLGEYTGIIPARIFWKQINIIGSTMGSDSDFKSMLEFVGKHAIKPEISSIYKFTSIHEAFQCMETGGQNGKIILDMQ